MRLIVYYSRLPINRDGKTKHMKGLGDGKRCENRTHNKNPERRIFRDFLMNQCTNQALRTLSMWRVRSSILLEKPHSLRAILCISLRSLRSHVPVEHIVMPDFPVSLFFPYSILEDCFFLFVVVLHTTTIFVLDYNNKMSAKQAPDPFCTLIGGRWPIDGR